MAPDDIIHDATAPTERRIDALLAEMTLAEKAAQLSGIPPKQIGVTPGKEMIDDDGELNYDVLEEYLGDGIGHLTQVASQGLLEPEDAAERINEFQRYLLEETRLGIPAIEHEECLAGYRGPGGTAFPQSIGMASTWSPTLMESITDSIRHRLAAVGTVQALSPVLDVARELRWGRVEETFGEDPQLVAAMAHAYVSGLQADGEGIDATLKHFAGHGNGEGGTNRASLQVGERELREVYLYPFEVAVREADARAVMNAYHDIDGVPCGGSKWLLTDVLRGEWGFDGHVVADYFSVDLLKEEHGIADTQREAGVAALEAGLDVELPATDCYGENLVEAVEAGELSEATVDTAVRRVLRAKIESGVFDDPYVDPEAASEPFDTDERTELAARAARESMTLLENDGLLPLSADELDSVALVGPQADDGRGQVGDYTHAARFDSEEEGDFECVTPRDALETRGEEAGFHVEYVEGATTTGPSTDEFDAAAEAVADADVAVACVGARSDIDFADRENPAELPDVPTSGENCDVTDLGLPGVQEELLDRLAETDTPVVVVLVSGKPHAIPEIADRAPALVQAWLPGEDGGNAIADVIFGEHNPGGHLPVSIPKDVGQQPVYYSRKPNSASEEYVYVDNEPLYPFGYGRSYTDFEYGDLTVDAEAVAPMGSLTASVTVTNAGDRAGHDVVQLYQHAENPSQARPVQELLGFRRVHLEPGESKRVTFEIDATQLAYHNLNMDLAVEEGPYELRVGKAADEIVDTAEIEVTETKVVPRSARTYLTETNVETVE